MLFTGYCPTQKCDYTIDVSYIDASDSEEQQYVKGTFSCKYNSSGDECSASKCPIYKCAPTNK